MPGRVEAYRVFFGLAAFWAALSVPLWLWGVGPQTAHWHVTETGLGFVAALIAGYSLSACAAWSGRAPVRGGVVLALALLWLCARAAWVAPPPLAEILARMLNAAVFAAIAALVWREWRHGLCRAQVPPFIIAVCLCLSVGALFVQGGQPQLVLVPVWLVVAIGSRMLAAFLDAAAQRAGARPDQPVWPLGHAALVTLGAALVTSGILVPGLLLATSVLLAGFMASLPLRHVRGDALLGMMALALACIVIGLAMLGQAHLGWADAMPGASASLHLIMIGGMGGMGIAVMSRASALRMAGHLKARRGAVGGFCYVLLAGVLRMSDLLAPAAASWSLGWGLVLLAHVQACAQPVPRPIFSAKLG